jgi:hypothetical protein
MCILCLQVVCRIDLDVCAMHLFFCGIGLDICAMHAWCLCKKVCYVARMLDCVRSECRAEARHGKVRQGRERQGEAG